MTLLGRALVIAAVGAVLGLGLNAVRPDGIALRAVSAPAVCSAPAAAASALVAVSATTAGSLCGDPGVLVADARAADRYARGHVAGALHLPCAASGSAAAAAVARLRGKHTLVVYGDSTEEARPVAEELRRRAGAEALRVVVLEGGFSAWNEAGLACSSGPCPDCAEEKARRP